MSACFDVPTLKTILLVEDQKPPPKVVFAVTEINHRPIINQYVRLDYLPDELREVIRKLIWD
jgi:hypothetical protein